MIFIVVFNNFTNKKKLLIKQYITYLHKEETSTLKPAYCSHHLKKFHFLIISILLIAPVTGYCQGMFDAGVNIGIAVPQGEFRDTIDRNGFSFSGTGLIRPGLVPVKFGIELGYINYGSEKRREPFSYTIPDVRVRVERTNNIFLGHMLVRLQQDAGTISPYLDGLVGFNYLWTTTKIRDADNFEEITSSKNLDDIAFSYGLGGGIMFNVYEARTPVTDIGKIYIDLKVRYLYGGEAEYLKEGAVSIDEYANVSYDISKSTTDLMLYQIGVVFSF